MLKHNFNVKTRLSGLPIFIKAMTMICCISEIIRTLTFDLSLKFCFEVASASVDVDDVAVVVVVVDDTSPRGTTGRVEVTPAI